MHVGLHEPQRVIAHRILVARHLLLLPSPVGQLDLVREQVAPLQRMAQPERRPQRPYTLIRLLIPPIPMLNLHNPIIIRIPRKVRHPIRRHLVLEVDVAHGRADVVRVQVALRLDVAQLDAIAVLDIAQWLRFPFKVWVSDRSRVDYRPVVIFIAVRVEGDLLFYRTRTLTTSA